MPGRRRAPRTDRRPHGIDALSIRRSDALDQPAAGVDQHVHHRGLVQIAVGVLPRRDPQAQHARLGAECRWRCAKPQSGCGCRGDRRGGCRARGSFAGFGSAEAGGWPWIEFAYTPETEVHREPTGALQA